MDWIEVVGYIGSALVLVSFLMTSVFKLRVINTIGGIIFAIYALIIKSYPTAVMNIALVIINLRFLWKMRTDSKVYDLVETTPADNYLGYLLGYWAADIKTCFPGLEIDLSASNIAYILGCESNPAGLFLAAREGDELKVQLDYSLPAYRDFSLGAYLYGELAKRGISKVSYSGPDENHKVYLEKMGFVPANGGYEKILG